MNFKTRTRQRIAQRLNVNAAAWHTDLQRTRQLGEDDEGDGTPTARTAHPRREQRL